MRVHSFDIGAEQMKTLLPQVDVLTSIALRQDSGAGSILRCVLDELIAASKSLDDEERPYRRRGTASCRGRTHGDAGGFARGARANGSLPPCANPRFVRDNLRRADLGPEMVARGVGLSTRRVHELFGSEPSSLMRWIWQERLQRCRAELAAPSLSNRSVAEIAFSLGLHQPGPFQPCLSGPHRLRATRFPPAAG